VIQTIAKAYTLEKSDGSLAALLVVMGSQKDHGQLNVLQSAHRCKQVESLEYESDMAQAELRQILIR